jgi:ATP-dependent Clp protease protease subunit
MMNPVSRLRASFLTTALSLALAHGAAAEEKPAPVAPVATLPSVAAFPDLPAAAAAPASAVASVPAPAAAVENEAPPPKKENPRTVLLRESIDDDVAIRVQDELIALDQEAPGKPIYLRIDSGGGSIWSGLRIYDAMKSLHSPVATVCENLCGSMAAVLLTAGTPGLRTASPSAVVIIHEMSAKAPEGTYSIVKSGQELNDILEDKLLTILSDYSGHSKEELADRLRGRDVSMTAEKAVQQHFIDSIIAPLQHPPKFKRPPAHRPAAARVCAGT